MNNNQYCVIMAGGYSKQFWPLCKQDLPKQFTSIEEGGKSYIQATYDRCAGLFSPENIIVITLDKYKDLVYKHLPELPKQNLLLEPYGKNTGPCTVYSTYSILKRNPKAVIMSTPSDLIINEEDKFNETISKALEYAQANEVLMTLGIRPTYPNPNFGYIQIKGGKEAYNNDVPIQVKTFIEKPDVDLAKIFCKSGEFFWNSGIFVWKAEVIRQEMEKYIPQITNLFGDWQLAIGTNNERAFIERAYIDCDKISIDYGVMEKTDIAQLFPAKFDWKTVNNWNELYCYSHKDEDGNSCNTENKLLEDCNENMIISKDKKKFIAIKGLKDYVVIDTPDALMICPKNDSEYKDFITKMAMPEYDKFL